MRSRLAITVALAIAVASCTAAEEEPTSTLPATLPSLDATTTTQEPEPVETTVVDEAYLWQVADCVDLGADASAELPYAPYGTELLTDCAAPHTHEVFYTAVLPEGPTAPYPDNLNGRLFDICFVEFADVMGFSSSDSTLELVLYLPDAEEWAAGERYHACVFYQPGTGVVYRPLVGSAADDPDRYAWQVNAGTCYVAVDLQLLAVSDTVACAEEHTLEMIGEAEPTSDDPDYPGLEAVAQLAAEACNALLTEYAVLSIDDLPVLTFALPTLLSEGEWDTGKRTVRCFAFAGTSERGLLIMIGSLSDETFEIVGANEGLSA